MERECYDRPQILHQYSRKKKKEQGTTTVTEDEGNRICEQLVVILVRC